MNVVIAAALKDELEPVRTCLDSETRLCGQANFVFVHTGIGIKSTRSRMMPFFNDQKIDLVLNIGTAGALKETLFVYDFFLPARYQQLHDGHLETIASRELFPVFEEFTFPDWKTGTLITSEHAVVDNLRKTSLRSVTEAEAVDMEAFALADLCRKNAVSFLSLKVISDTADKQTNPTFKAVLNRIQILLPPAVAALLTVVINPKPVPIAHG